MTSSKIALPYAAGTAMTVYADPPWPEHGGGKVQRGADRHYPLMPVEDIAAMGVEVQRVTSDQSHLYLWVTNNWLKDGLHVMEAWGYRYITMATWFKGAKIGLGQYFRGNTEHCLFGIRGPSLPYRISSTGKRNHGVTGFQAVAHDHSVKPPEMREMIEQVSYPIYLELFARRKVDGWITWGNEIDAS